MKRKTEKKKVVKRITAIISAASVMTAAFGFVLPASAAAPTQGTLPFYASFSDADWFAGGRGDYTTADTGDELYGKAWTFKGWEAVTIKLGSEALTNKKLVVSFDIKVNALGITDDTTVKSVLMARFNNAASEASTYQPLQIRASKDALKFYTTNGQNPNGSNETIVDVTNNRLGWHRVDMVLDVNNTQTTVDYYVDGSNAGFIQQPMKVAGSESGEKNMGSVYSLLIDPAGGVANTTNGGDVYIDNLNIRETSAMTVASSSYDNTTRTLNVEFNDTIAANAETAITVEKANYSDQSVVDADNYTVTKPTANTLKIVFNEGALASSSGYTLKGVSSAFGSTAADISFTVPSSKSVKVVEDFTGATDNSNGTVSDTKLTLSSGDGNAKFSLVEGKNGGTDKALNIKRDTGASTGGAAKVAFSYYGDTYGFANARRLGKVTYSFDFKETTAGPAFSFNQNNTLAEFNVSSKDMYDNWRVGDKKNNYRVFGKYTSGAWHNLKFELDYDNQVIKYYYDDACVMELRADQFVEDYASQAKSNINYVTKADFEKVMGDDKAISYAGAINWNNTSDSTGLEYTIDNFTVEYEETATVGMDEDNDISIKNLTVAPGTGDDTANYVVTAKAVNTYAVEKTANIIVCGYDANGVLVDVQLNDVTLGALRCTEVSEKFNLTAENIASVRAFAWNGDGSLIPLGQSAQYTVGE